jgi:hypothetical protein
VVTARLLAVGLALAGAVAACGGADASSLVDGDGGLANGDASVTPGDDGGVVPGDDGGVNPGDDAAASDATTGDDAAKDAAASLDAAKKDPGVYCGQSLFCDPNAALCCITQTSWYPQPQFSYACQTLPTLTPCVTGTPVYCDDDHDCASGVCCGDLGGNGSYAKVSCKATCTGYVYTYQQIHFCDPNAPTCDSNQTCQPSAVLDGYYVCN